jgi:hypothetical protein
MADRTRASDSGRTRRPLETRLTVAGETPANRATS